MSRGNWWLNVLITIFHAVVALLLWGRGSSGWALVFWAAAGVNTVFLVGSVVLQSCRTRP
jgi:hypothetical protein